MNAQAVKIADSLKSISSISPPKSIKRQGTIILQDFNINNSLPNLNFSVSDSLVIMLFFLYDV